MKMTLEEQATAYYLLYKEGNTLAQIGAKYSVTRQAVHFVLMRVPQYRELNERLEITKEDLRDFRLVKKWSLKKIGEYYNVSAVAIYKHCKRWGIKSKTCGDTVKEAKKRVKAITTMLQDKAKITEIAQTLELNPETVRRLIRENKIKKKVEKNEAKISQKKFEKVKDPNWY